MTHVLVTIMELKTRSGMECWYQKKMVVRATPKITAAQMAANIEKMAPKKEGFQLQTRVVVRQPEKDVRENGTDAEREKMARRHELWLSDQMPQPYADGWYTKDAETGEEVKCQGVKERKFASVRAFLKKI